MNKTFLTLFAALIFIAAFTLFIPVCHAEEEIFNKSIESGYSIDVDNDYNFIITLNKYGNSIFVNGGDSFQSVQKGTCKSLGEVYKVCFAGVYYDETDDKVYANVSMYRRSPDITITKTVSDTDLYVGEETTVTITIKNTGDNAEKVTLIDDYPASIQITEVEGPGCFEHENAISWSGHMNTGVTKTCTFTIVGKEELHQEFAAKLRYWTGLKWETEYSARATLDIEPTISFQTSIVRENYEFEGRKFDWEEELPNIYPGEEPRLLVEITNNQKDKDITINNLEVLLPEDTDFIQTSNLRFNFDNSSGDHESIVWDSDRIDKITSQRLKWNGQIGNNSNKRYILKIRNARTGLQNILIKLKYTVDYDDGSTTIEDEKTISYLVREPGMGFNLALDDEAKLFSVPIKLRGSDNDDTKADIQSMHPYRFTVFAQNLNPFADISNANLWITTDMANFSKKQYPTIGAEDQKIPWSLHLIPPEIYTDKTYKLNISSTFKNAFGERLYNTTEFEFTVKAFKPIIINHESDEGNILEGKEKTTFKVTLKNERVTDIKNVKVWDEIPEEFQITGVTSNRLKLVADDEMEVYKYEIIPPVLSEKRRFNITTHVSYFDEDSKMDFNNSYTTTITVIPREPEVAVELTIDEPEDIYPGSLMDATIKITNNDAQDELIKDITVYFPLQKEFDIIGPKTVFVDKLDPEESIELKNIIKFRPKLTNKSLKLKPTVVEFFDSYGNRFTKNTTEETFEVLNGKLSGPAIFLLSKIPVLANLSTDIPITLDVRNLGNEPAKMTINAGERQWDISVPPLGLKTLTYNLNYAIAGNYTIPAPTAKIKYHDNDMYTAGSERSVEVKLLHPTVTIPEAVVEPTPVVQVGTGQESNIEEIEESLVKEQKKEQAKRNNLTLYAIIGLVILVFIVGYIFYHKGKKESEAPFLK